MKQTNSNTQEQGKRTGEIYKVTIVGFLTNVGLTAGKFLAGIFGHSGAMIADAVHSLSDLATEIIVLFFVKVSSKPRDKDHNYGHGKYETLATIIVALALGAVGIGIMISSTKSIHSVIMGRVLPRPGSIALWAAAISIVVKEILYWYTLRVGKRVESNTVIANAWHHRSDALSSIGALVGIACAHFLSESWRILDPIAAIVVAVMIFVVAYNLLVSSISELMEKALPEEVEERILEIIGSDSRVLDPHNLRTRRVGSSKAIDIHIRVDGQMSVSESHSVTVEIENRLREEYGQTTIVSVHVEPQKM